METETVAITVTKFVPFAAGGYCQVEISRPPTAPSATDLGRVIVEPWLVGADRFWIVRVNGVDRNGGNSKGDIDIVFEVRPGPGDFGTYAVTGLQLVQKPTSIRANKVDIDGLLCFPVANRTFNGNRVTIRNLFRPAHRSDTGVYWEAYLKVERTENGVREIGIIDPGIENAE